MAPKIDAQFKGPVGKHLDGKPLNDTDRGGLYAVVRVMKRQRQMEVDFGATLQWVAMTPDAAIQQAQAWRNRVWTTWGKMDYKVEELPIIVAPSRERRVVICQLPVLVEVLRANPEVFLAWAQRLEEAAAQLQKGPNNGPNS